MVQPSSKGRHTLNIRSYVLLSAIVSYSVIFAVLATAFSVTRSAVLSRPHYSPLHAFSSTRLVCWASSSPESEPKKGRGNDAVRKLLHIITARCEKLQANRMLADTPNPRHWNKTRNFLYRNADRLSSSQVRQVLDFLEEAFPSDGELVVSVLQQSPRILRKNVRTHLQPTVAFLRQLYDEELFYQAVSRNPDLLLTTGVGYDTDALDAVTVFLQDELDLSIATVSKLKRTAPFVFQIKLAQLFLNVFFLKNVLQDGGYSDEVKINKAIGKVVSSHPQILQLSVEKKLQPALDYLRAQCQLNPRDISTVVFGSGGAVLGLSLVDNLQPTVRFLSQVLAKYDTDDVSSELRRCIVAHPGLLCLSITNLRAKVEYFNSIDICSNSNISKLGSHKRSNSSLAARILTRAPAVYSLSLATNIVPTIEFLSCVWGTTAKQSVVMQGNPTTEIGNQLKGGSGVSLMRQPALAALLKEYPTVLTLSLEGNLRPTVKFYNRTKYIFLDADWNNVANGIAPFESAKSPTAKSPTLRGRYLAASLFHRLLPRWHYFCCCDTIETNKSRSPKGLALPAKPPLHILVSSSDAAFCEHMGFDPDDFRDFQTQAIPRLKFSSQFDTWLRTGRPIDE
jgi:hypothetical protein